ncbi:MAG: serine/threonine-protein kinase [Phycisphaerae bacterium]
MMTAQQWQRLKLIFEEALRRPAKERASYLSSVCGGDGELRSEAESLLASHDAAPDYLDQSEIRPEGLVPPDFRIGAAAKDGAPCGSAAPERIGPYRLEREIAAGGMGVVYLAARDDDAYQKRVAVKLIRQKPEFDGRRQDDALRRFRQERQTLAALDHPNIARLLDGGAASDGSPYIVMEFVDGRPIDEFCDQERLTIAQRLLLFLQVGAAVQYAHRNLVVHRDLKPSNVLVTADGMPKLLDFGIAKLLRDGERPETETAAVMTPRYASPEQLTGGPITTASDVYSLGVMLYELLTGQHPSGDPSRSAMEFARDVRERPVTPPSSVVERSHRGATRTGSSEFNAIRPELTALRRTNPSRLRRTLHGDLDSILLTALRKEPQSRYASVEQFCADVESYLHGLPVRARGAALGYRVRKFLGRHSVVAGAAAVALAALISGLAAATRSAQIAVEARNQAQGLLTAEQEARRQAEENLRRAESAEREARAQAERVQRVTEFLLSIFDEANPYSSHATAGVRAFDVPVGEIVNRAAQALRQRGGVDPEVQASLLYALAEVYRKLGDYNGGFECALQCLDLRTHVPSPDHADRARADRLAGECLISLERYDEADQHIARAARYFEAHTTPGDPELAYTLDTWARCLLYQERYAEAESLLQRGIGILRGQGRDGPNELAELLHNYGVVLSRSGRSPDAEPWFREALRIREEQLPADHPRTASTRHSLGAALMRMGRAAEAEPLLRQSLDVRERVLPAGHVLIESVRASLGDCLIKLGRSDEGEPLLRAGFESMAASLGIGHRRTRAALEPLIEFYENSGRAEDAAVLRKRLAEAMTRP